ncbi:hypothetical protein Aeqsu_1541 [Aequorivita sublithincola DSM 14238]|uniref:Lipoprotein n=1 Tax=Aequorivita sublithincola (strain DSM 14238 / LMG 21431 / ACAM 643 / 9-3) TaxID=746697 RepID=I3YRJ3_AEQSU|nr:hypothetical protein [Aequorivita sublithincola]AFL79611.1 hypothetical protein Aeqsu_0079 [Aequorivita sublithincola DSM 14238]AFL81026.1 hypothetical protein Aeqsu_1541 [Aequorivita sublithincola DSM 14238]
MKKQIAIILSLFISLLSCGKKETNCEEHSSAYWTTTMFGTPHNSKIQGENFTIRKAFQEIKDKETDIVPANGYITLKIHIDKYGKYCNQENFQINAEYKPTDFNNGKLIAELEKISQNLRDWQNDTETKTYYLIRLTIKNGKIEEIF